MKTYIKKLSTINRVKYDPSFNSSYRHLSHRHFYDNVWWLREKKKWERWRRVWEWHLEKKQIVKMRRMMHHIVDIKSEKAVRWAMLYKRQTWGYKIFKIDANLSIDPNLTPLIDLWCRSFAIIHIFSFFWSRMRLLPSTVSFGPCRCRALDLTNF